MREKILYLRKRIADFVMQAIPQEKEKEDPRKVMSTYALLYEIDNELMEFEAQSFLLLDSEWEDYVVTYSFAEIEQKLTKIDPIFFV